jgi:hypothetical protein
LLFPFGYLGAQITYPALGYLINNEGDTLVGTLNLDNEIILSREVKFQASVGNTEVEVYTPMDLQEFGFKGSGKIYRKIRHQYHDFDREEDIEENRMAQILYEGPYELYRLGLFGNEYFKIVTGIPPWVYYLKTPDGDMVKLEITERQITGVYSRISEKYRGSLKYVMRDWPEAIAAIDNITYTDEDLVELLNKYLAYTYPDFTPSGKLAVKKTTKFKHFAQLSWVPSPAVQNKNFVNNCFGFSYFFRTFNPAVDNSFEIGLGLEYLKFNYDEGQDNEPFRLDGGWAIRIPVWADYYVTKGKKVQPFLKFGLIASLLAENGEIQETETIILPGGQIQIVPVGYVTYLGRSPRILFGVGGGVNVGRLRVDVQYEKVMRFVFNVGYRLN